MLDHVAQHDDQLPLVSVPDATTATQLGGEAPSTQRNRQTRRGTIRVTHIPKSSRNKECTVCFVSLPPSLTGYSTTRPDIRNDAYSAAHQPSFRHHTQTRAASISFAHSRTALPWSVTRLPLSSYTIVVDRERTVPVSDLPSEPYVRDTNIRPMHHWYD